MKQNLGYILNISKLLWRFSKTINYFIRRRFDNKSCSIAFDNLAYDEEVDNVVVNIKSQLMQQHITKL
jgi:hypothetical protein